VEEHPFPWVFPFVEDARAAGAYVEGTVVLRPVVEVQLLGPALNGPAEAPRLAGIVDSGSERTLAQQWLARAIGVTPDERTEITIGIGGRARRVQFADVQLRVSPYLVDPGTAFHEWSAHVGFFVDQWEAPWSLLLGQRGFFDEFTVTMSRLTQAIAIEARGVFDQRFASEIETAERRDPRLQ
jgi:hypothetical protein